MYLVGCKLGFQNVIVGRINRVAAGTGFLMRKCTGVSTGQKKQHGRNNEVTVLTRWPWGAVPLNLICSYINQSINCNATFFPSINHLTLQLFMYQLDHFSRRVRTLKSIWRSLIPFEDIEFGALNFPRFCKASFFFLVPFPVVLWLHSHLSSCLFQ